MNSIERGTGSRESADRERYDGGGFATAVTRRRLLRERDRDGKRERSDGTWMNDFDSSSPHPLLVSFSLLLLSVWVRI